MDRKYSDFNNIFTRVYLDNSSLGSESCFSMMGQGYSLNPLLNMRIHDINVEADPNKHAPAGPDPVEADGTDEGSLDPELYKKHAYEDAVKEVDEILTFSWGLILFWPVLNMVIQCAQLGIVVYIHATADLLNPFTIQSASFELPFEILWFLDYLEAFAVAGIMNAIYQLGLGLLAVAEYLMISPDAFSKGLIISGIAILVANTAVAVYKCESAVIEGEWHHGQALAYYFAFVYLFLRYSIGVQSTKGIISSLVIGAVLLGFGTTMENMADTLSETTKPLKWTKLVIWSILAFYIIMFLTHLAYVLM